MASEKHGRLFTEADMLDLVKAAYERGVRDADAGDAGLEADRDFPGLMQLLADTRMATTFPADEPLFVLRGSTAPVEIRRSLVDPLLTPYADELQGWLRETRDWQEQHPDRVKVPG